MSTGLQLRIPWFEKILLTLMGGHCCNLDRENKVCIFGGSLAYAYGGQCSYLKLT